MLFLSFHQFLIRCREVCDDISSQEPAVSDLYVVGRIVSNTWGPSAKVCVMN